MSPYIEQRLTNQLILYWQERRGARKMPALADMNEAELSEFNQDCYVLKILPRHDPNYKFHFVGKHIIDTISSHYPHHWELVRRMVEPLGEAILRRAPQPSDAVFACGDQMIKFRQIMLPLSSDGDEVNYVFCGARHRIETVRGDMPDTVPAQNTPVEKVDNIAAEQKPDSALTQAEKEALATTEQVRSALQPEEQN